MIWLKKLCLALTIVLIMVGYVFAEGDNANTGFQRLCPVMFVGDIGCTKLNKEIFTDYRGQRIYFCSKDCLEKFKENPDIYIERMKAKDSIVIPSEEKNKLSH